MNEKLYELPFDQFQRYKLVEEIVGLVKNGSEKIRILDVGGYPGLISDFLPDDETFILDVVPCDKPNYILGDGTAIPFDDSSFDLVMAIDTLEHIPIEKRQKFISELLRVSSKYIIVMGPFFGENIQLAERMIFEFSLKTLGQDFADKHPLKEHIENGLPRMDQFEEEINKLNCYYKVFPSGYLYNWLILNFVKHFLFTIPDSNDLHKMIDKYYNLYFYENDKRDPSYRNMFFIAKESNRKTLDKVDKKLKYNSDLSVKDLSYKLQLFGLLMSLFDLGAKRELHELKRYNIKLEETLGLKERDIENKDLIIEELKSENEKSILHILEIENQIKSKEAHIQNLEKSLLKFRNNLLYRFYRLFKDLGLERTEDQHSD
ncbi:MAG: class I SAM-dependent methyltransferase [Actinobacteria bacterium]|nr:class I SAM-dependent methyltransferase [Actinomycetota bacterium]